MAFEVNEKTTSRVTGVFRDEANAVIGTTEMTTLVATLYDKVAGTIINSRDEQDVLNTNGGTLDASGNFTIQLDVADNIILDQTNVYEVHVLLLEWTYDSGAKGGNQEIELYVVNLANVT
jgi:hypothetical protein